MPAISGEEYKKRVDGLNAEIWLDGAQVTGKLSCHPAFSGVIKTQAELYDLQLHPKYKKELTFLSDTTGNEIGTSYLIPKTKEDLEKRRQMIQCWARSSGGLLGRSPDYMNTVLASFAASVSLLAEEENCYPDRLLSFYEEAREKDLTFTHAFVNPQTNRGKLAFLEEDVTNARIVRREKAGLIIRGAKLLATQGGITDEIIVYSAPGAQESDHTYCFSIPSNTKGLKFICRESFSIDKSSYNFPLSSRFDEMDTVVIFDEVLVPWERVFLHDNIRAANEFYKKGKFVPFTLHQIISRQIIKLEFLLGVAHQIVETINIGEYQHVQAKVVEIVKGLESLKALLHYSEHQAEIDNNGIMTPSVQPLYVAINQSQELYPRLIEIIQLLGASGLMTIPHEETFESRMGDDLSHYLKAGDCKGKERVALFRLAWDLTMSSFGSRQTLYERFFFGDPVRISQTIYQMYDEESSISLVSRFLKES
ncbi:4-hydroxyphenylacetate 3-monooxygenase, oxygenase component [Halobacillus sp. K22]|uniref:4-hydroxyphenylacetate 3-monooxygenase, oxygenase component n=1 Tax=Halobacillus sp. K22 TaxID=3457431 RepID=UPI003FCE733B